VVEVSMFAKLHWWHLLIGVALMIISAALVFMWFDTTPPYIFYPEESTATQRGSTLEVDWKVKVNRLCEGSNVRELFDPKTKLRLAIYDPVPTATSASIVGKNDDHLIRVFELPPRPLPRRVGYRSHLSYKCTLLQRFFPLELDTPDLFFEPADHP